jgi:hypothetical protein
MIYPDKVRIGATDYYIPFADEVPYDEKHLAVLEEDIRETGEVVIPIILWKEKSTATTETVVDGIHRVLIAGKLGLTEVPTDYHSYATEEAARAECRRLNINRRHLTGEQLSEQRQKRLARVAQARREGKSMRHIANMENVSTTTIQNDLSILAASGENVDPISGKVFGKDKKWQTASKSPATKKPKTTVYGDPIAFRHLRYAPINEMGVVFLFGMVALELGFVVESVQGPYPDCEGKRQIGPGKWQKVRIEFEFESRNFKLHEHDPNGCDVIVCWKHNWSECPPNLEVVELRKVIKTLSSSID